MFRKVTNFINNCLYCINIELIFFVSGMIYLALLDPWEAEHYHFCLIKIFNIGYCPGCGLGRSISFLLHGRLLASIYEHPLGIVGMAVIISRIYEIIIKQHKNRVLYLSNR
jgi:hypothetical protein